MTAYIIPQIGQAINYWCAVGSGDEFALDTQARALAYIYDLMIYSGRAHVALADLIAGQAGALTTALDTQ